MVTRSCRDGSTLRWRRKRERRLALVGLIGATIAIASVGCGQTADRTASKLSVQIRVSGYSTQARKRVARDYTLRCQPAGGTIPFVARLCGDIARHPLPMLDPGRSRSVCAGAVNGPVLSVSSNRHGTHTSFSGEPGCDWPGGTGLLVYWAASLHDTRMLSRAEPRLRCDDDPQLLSRPTPWRSVFACTHGLWTPRTAKLIALAEQVPPISWLTPRTLFPPEIGTRRCLIDGGGLGRHKLDGRCEVNVTHVWRRPQVTFTESWPAGHVTRRHTWVMTVASGAATLTKQNGPVAPQFWD